MHSEFKRVYRDYRRHNNYRPHNNYRRHNYRRHRFESLERRNLLATLAINAGGPAIGDFLADQLFTGGATFGPNNNSISPISVAGVTNPAPADVYRTERTGINGTTGDFLYTIPDLVPGAEYDLRLHFAEIFFESAGSRVFDVRVNGAAVPILDNYDVFVASNDPGSAVEQAVIEEFTVTANVLGVLELEFTPSQNNAKLSALELTGEFLEPDGPVFKRVADTPINVFEGQGAAAGDRLYLIGGFIDGLDVTRETHAYDPVMDEWTQVADFPAITEEIINEDGTSTGQFVTGGITHGASAVDGDNIYVVGGYVGQSPGQATAVVSVYDTQLNQWSPSTSLPEPRGGGGTAIVGRQLHYFGGGTRTFGIGTIFDKPEHWVLDLGPTDSPNDDATEWVQLADLPTLRNHSAGATIDGIVYAIGGQAGSNEVTANQVALEAFDPATGQWSSRADIPIPLGHLMASTAVVDGKLVIVGGVTDQGNPAGQNGTRRTATVFSYDPQRDEWRQLESIPGERQSPVVGLVGDQLIVASGLSASGREFTTFSADVNVLFAEPPRVLFVRGADRSGGFLEANNDFGRTEQLADIFNASTAGGNHGWNELRLTLEDAGFAVEQITETAENASGPSQGIAIDFASLDLSQYDAIMFGSNNAVYDQADIDAIEAYIRGGGGALFISDANFGSDWADASNSDQQFLDRFGLRANQDQGTYSLTRSNGEFLVPDSPLFAGVNRIDGEGVTPIQVINPQNFDVEVTTLALAEGNTRLNEPPFGGNNQGPSRSAGPNDAAVLIASAGAGRIAGHFDRNTFFNQNGAGTNINRFDNQQYAINLFSYLVGAFDEPPPSADFDMNGSVNGADFLTWQRNFGSGTTFEEGDANRDGDVDGMDLDVWQAQFGSQPPAIAAVAAAQADRESVTSTSSAPAAATLKSPPASVFTDNALIDAAMAWEQLGNQARRAGVITTQEESVLEERTIDAIFANIDLTSAVDLSSNNTLAAHQDATEPGEDERLSAAQPEVRLNWRLDVVFKKFVQQ